MSIGCEHKREPRPRRLSAVLGFGAHETRQKQPEQRHHQPTANREIEGCVERAEPKVRRAQTRKREHDEADPDSLWAQPDVSGENRKVRAPKSERGSVLNAALPPYKVARKRRCYAFKMATISIDRGSTMTI